MARKFIFGINYESYEESLCSELSKAGIETVVVKSVTYREAILSALPGSGADTLIFRDTLPGSMDTGKLLEQIRVDFPNVQIIFICSVDPTDSILTKCVTLGIYDIINNNAVGTEDVVRHVTHSGNFRDVYQYYSFRERENAREENEKEGKGAPAQKHGLLAGLFAGAGRGVKAPGRGNGNLAIAENRGDEPHVDQELMRQVIQESAIREAQQDVDELIHKAVSAETEELSKEIGRLQGEIEAEKRLANQREEHITSLLSELDEGRRKLESVQGEYERYRASSRRELEACEGQLRTLRSDVDTPKWYARQEQKWQETEAALREELSKKTARVKELESLTEVKEAQLAGLKAAADEKSAELAELLERKNVTSQADADAGCAWNPETDYSYPATPFPRIPEPESSIERVGETRTVICLGAKHGVGNSTCAQNLAAALATRGYKTLLVELNGHFPMNNEFFELTNIPTGLDHALAEAEGNTLTVDAAIVRFHALRPAQGAIAKAYRKLPTGFHLMTYSNEALVRSLRGDGNEAFDGLRFAEILKYLSEKQKYTRIVLDMQPEGISQLDGLLEAGASLHRLIITMSQDTHSISTAGVLISQLSKRDASALISRSEFAIGKYNSSAHLTASRIAKNLSLPAARFTTLSEDTLGYMDAVAAATPYLINNGRFRAEYETLRAKVEV